MSSSKSWPSAPLPPMPLADAIPTLRRALLIALAIGLPVVALVSGHWAAVWARADLLAASQGALELFRANLASEVDKNEAVPFLLARDHDVVALLATPALTTASALTERLNRKLEDIQNAIHAAALYVMDTKGLTIAASNWNSDASFIGQNFNYRPYFHAAMAGTVGRYFALGTTSHQPGYYIAYPVRAENRTVGAVVIKVGMERIEQSWSAGPGRVAVTDGDGVIVITNIDHWRFHSLAPLPALDRARIEASHKYDDLAITPLPITIQTFATAMPFGPAPPLMILSDAVPGTDLTLHVLSDPTPIRTRAVAAALIGGLAVVIAVLLGFLVLGRWIRAQERLAEQQRAREDVERRVQERTADLAEAYDQLSREMRERERAEHVLRAAQIELVQATKLAALGQMSAGVAHEINQPLSAIRAFAENAVTLLERGRTSTVYDNLTQIAELTQRMAGITQHLKGFARKAAGTLGPVSLPETINKALMLVAPQIRAAQIDVIGAPHHPPPVLAEDVRLQQVLVNLFTNAIDAMKGCPHPCLTLDIHHEREHGEVTLRVRDTGPGIAAADLPHLFVPFFTTKGATEGLGLGLSITSGIIQDFGGTIAAANHADGGAEFTIRLRALDSNP